MKKLTMLLLACALMALTNAAAVPEGKPEAVKEEASVQEAAPEAEPVVEEPPAEEDVPEEELEVLADESFVPEGKNLPEESEDMEMLQNIEEDDSLTRDDDSCDRGWRRYRDRCFIYIRSRVSWIQAERNCESLDGHLVSIHNSAEYNFIQQMIDDDAWIGASDEWREGVWRWSDGSGFFRSYWCPGEPNNEPCSQDCAQMIYRGRQCWDAVSCSLRRPYVCADDL